MEALLQMLALGGDQRGGVQEDALMAIGTLVEGNLCVPLFFGWGQVGVHVDGAVEE